MFYFLSQLAADGDSVLGPLRLFRYVTAVFLWDLSRQTLINLWHDGSLLRASTWRSAWRLLLARDGMFRASFGAWRDYFARDFHPRQHDASLSSRWLHDHAAEYAVVTAPLPARRAIEPEAACPSPSPSI